MRGEPSEHTVVTIEDAIKRDYERWMIAEDEEVDPPGTEEAAEAGDEDGDDLDDLRRTDLEKE